MTSPSEPSIRYFAYGRNMHTDAIALACPEHRFLGAAELRGHRLAFTRRSVRTGAGVADIVAAAGRSVWGALYELDPAALAALDEKEGAGWAYERRAVRVLLGGADRTHDGDVAGFGAVEAFAYAVIAREGEHVPPSRDYVQAMLDGARERGLPDAYMATLVALAASG